jgi:hypothetical protein
MPREARHRGVAHALRLALQARGEPAGEPLDQRRQVLEPLAERRHDELDHAQAVVQVRAVSPAPDLVFEIAVRRRDHAHVRGDGLAAPDALECALLQHAQDLRLGLE